MFDWIKNKPADVTVRHVPAILKDSWAPHARIFYTLELLGELDRLHLAVYHSYHVEQLYMSKPDVMEQWAVKNGIDARRWKDAYYSPEVDAKIARADAGHQALRHPGHAEHRRRRPLPHVQQHDARRCGGVIPVLDDLVRLARQNRNK